MFGKCGQQMHHQLVSVRVVGGNKINAAFHHARDEMDISSQAIELRYDQDCLGFLGSGDGGGELWPIRPLTALYLAEFPDQFAGMAGKVPLDCIALSVQPKSAATLTISGNPIIPDKFIGHGAVP